MDLGGLDRLNGDGVESPRGTKKGGETSKGMCKKRKWSKVGGEEEVTLTKEDLEKIVDVVTSSSEDR